MDIILSPETINYKFCPQCQTSKPESKFKRNQDWCRQCIKEAKEQVPDGMKFCPYCKGTKNIELFRGDSKLRDGYKSICKLCRNYRHLGQELDRKNRKLGADFNITLATYMEKLESQGGVCAACGYPETHIDHKTGKIKNLAVDHNHKTGEVRELLCFNCNVSLGFLQEDPARIGGLLRYILKYIA